MRTAALITVLLAFAGSVAGVASADPANGYVIHLVCDNGQTVDITSIPQAHNSGFQVIGNTSVTVAVGITEYDLDGNFLGSFLKPGHENQQLTNCSYVAPGVGYGTAEVLFTPLGH